MAQANHCRQYLELLASLNSLPAELYLAFGLDCEVAPLPTGIRLGKKGQCYANAGKLCLALPDLVYCEGYALKPGLIPVHHAWVLNTDGQALDPTWGYVAGTEYLGLPVNRDYLRSSVESRKYWGLFAETLPRDFSPALVSAILHPDWPASDEQTARFLKAWDRAIAALRRS